MDTFHFYNECMIELSIEDLKCQCFCVRLEMLALFFSLVHRALKPALKTFSVSVGLLCKLNNGHFSSVSYVYSDELNIEDLKCQCFFIYFFFWVHRGIEASIEDCCCQCWFVMQT